MKREMQCPIQLIVVNFLKENCKIVKLRSLREWNALFAWMTCVLPKTTFLRNAVIVSMQVALWRMWLTTGLVAPIAAQN